MTATLEQLESATRRLEVERAMWAAEQVGRARETTAMESRRRQRMLYGGSSFPGVQRHRMRFDGPGGQHAFGGAAWAHADIVTRDDLRRNAQALVRTNCMARAIVRQMKDSIVGTGPVLKAQTADPVWNLQAETLWHSYAFGDGALTGGVVFDAAGVSSVPARLREIVGDCLTDGAALDVLLKTGSVQAVETERLVNMQDDTAGVGGVATAAVAAGSDRYEPGVGGSVGGVRLDGQGRVTGYTIGQYAPTGTTLYGGLGGGWSVSGQGAQVVDAEHAILFPCPISSRTNLIIPEPGLAVSIPRFEQLEALGDNVRGAFYIATCFAAIITSKTPGLDQLAAPADLVSRSASSGGGVASTHPYSHEVDIEPGTIKFAQTGDTVSQVKPEHPSQQYESYVMIELSQIGADIGCPVLLAMADPRQTNYSGYRAMLALAYSGFKVWRAELERRWLHRVYARFIARMVMMGLLTHRADWYMHGWTWAPMPVLDPVSEVDAQSRAVASLLRSRTTAMAMLDGTDFDDELPTLKKEAESLRGAGLAAAYVGIAQPVSTSVESNRDLDAKPAEADTPEVA